MNEFSIYDLNQQSIVDRGLKRDQFVTIADTSISVVSNTGQPLSGAAEHDVILWGGYSSNISELPEIAEKYLRAYAIWKMFKRDSSDDSREQFEELMMMKASIVDSIAEQDGDVFDIPLINNEWFY